MTYKPLLASTALATALVVGTPAPAHALPPYIGQVTAFAGNYCPREWTDAHGQLLQISQYNALFSLYGTMYGGDGRTTFGLPDLRGRHAISQGTGAGLPPYPQGSKGGSTEFVLSVLNLPAHNHEAEIQTADGNANATDPRTAAFGRVATATEGYVTGVAPNARFMANGTVATGQTGGGQAVNKVSPYQTIRWCVSLSGIYPPRN